MAEKMIKHLLFTYGREVPNPHYVEGGDQGETIVVEGLGHLGEIIDITRTYDLERGERLGSFFTDDERRAIEAGTYTGLDAPTVYQSRLQEAQAAIAPAEGEGYAADVDNMSAEQLSDHINSGNDGKALNVQQTVELAGEGDNVDRINKVLDAEALATQEKGGPRAGVVKALEARLARATENSPDKDEQ